MLERQTLSSLKSFGLFQRSLACVSLETPYLPIYGFPSMIQYLHSIQYPFAGGTVCSVITEG